MQGLKDLKQEITEEARNVEVDLLDVILTALLKYSPSPDLSTYSTGAFLENLRVRVGSKVFKPTQDELPDIQNKLKKFMPGQISIHSTVGHTVFVEWIGWYGITDPRVWKNANHAPYKPMTRALQEAEGFFDAIVAKNNKTK